MPDGFGSGLSVLVVDDDQAVRTLLVALLGSEGFTVESASNLQNAMERVSGSKFDLLLVDKNLPDGSGLSLARHLLDKSADSEVVAMSAYASVDATVEAMQLSVSDFLVKPFERLDEILARLRRVIEHQQLKRHNRTLLEELRSKNKELEAMAIRDGLTGLYNHAFFQESLESELARSRRHGHEFGVVFLDLDRFKDVNDTLGHPVGDQVLRALAQVLRGQGRVSDLRFRLREQDIAARYGGDEFVLILPETSKAGTAVKAEQLRAFIEQYELGDGVPRQTLSLGVAAFPHDGTTRNELVRAADMALYAAKVMGRNRIVAYEPNLSEESPAGPAAKQMAALVHSITNRSFRFVYQPIVYAAANQIFGYEGLCRPLDDAFSSVMDLIATAERAGKIWDLGRVLRESVIGPMEKLPLYSSLFVNLHPYELNDPNFLDDSPLKPWSKRIVFEVTETGAIRDYKRFQTILDRLRGEGFRIALDDLGAGYSGLNALAMLEPDFVKLDIGMLTGIHSDSRSSRLIKHILEYADGEGIQVIAEGIETEEQRNVVTELGCPLLQGFYLAEPTGPFMMLLPKR